MPLALLALGLTSCDDELEPKAASGTLSLSNLGVEVENVDRVESRATVNVSNYLVDICSADGSEVVESYTYGKMPEVVTLTPGDYMIKVRSHQVQDAEWERPYYVGASEVFTIRENDITEVSPIKCKFASVKITVVFGPKLLAKIGTDVQVKVVANDSGSLTFSPYESHGSGYFACIEGSQTLVATFSGTVNGHFESFNRTYTDLAAGQHRIITYECGNDTPKPDAPSGSLNPGEGISVDVTYTDVDLTAAADPGKEEVVTGGGDKPHLDPIQGGGEDPNPGPDVPDEPTPTAAITFGGTLQNGGTYSETGLSVYNVVINCPAGCKDIVCEIQSDFLTAEELDGFGLADRMSLVNDEQYFNGLGSLPLPCGDAVKNQTVIDFNITDFMGMLGAVENVSTFILNVTDNEGNTASTKFTIVVK